MISKCVHPSLFTYNLLLKCIRQCGLGDEFETRKVIGQIIGDFHLLINTESNLEESNSSENNKLNILSIPNNNENKLSLTENRPNLLDVKPYFGDIVDISEVKSSEER